VTETGAAARRLGTLGAAALLFALACITIADPDLWGHLRFGADILASHRLPVVDPYSFTQDRPWINHEWLSEAVMAAAYASGGATSVALLKGALLFGTWFLVWRSLQHSAVPARLAAAGLTVLGAGSILGPMRPQIFTLVCVASLCTIVTSGSPGAKRWLPLLFAVWANLHGGWIVGLGVALMWALMAAAARRDSAWTWAVVAALSIAATLATPYGVGLWHFLWETVGFTRDVSEWQPLAAMPAMNWLPPLAVGAAAVWLLPSIDAGRRLQTGAVLALLAGCSVRVSRIAPLFAVAAAILLAPAIARRWPARSPVAVDSRAAAGLGVGGIAAAIVVMTQSLGQITVPASAPWVPSVAAATRLVGTSGRLVTYFDWGEYAIWHFGPSLRVSMDGRRETVYSARRLAEHDAIVAGTSDGLATLAAWQAEYVWLPARAAATRAWLAGHGYRIEYEGAGAFVAVRADLPARDNAPAGGGAEPRDFPR
jgi:hypothetical protein